MSISNLLLIWQGTSLSKNSLQRLGPCSVASAQGRMGILLNLEDIPAEISPYSNWYLLQIIQYSHIAPEPYPGLNLPYIKKGKDPLSCVSYHCISLFETILPSIISPDQTGFIENRYSFNFNLRRLCNIIYNPHTSTVSEALISLDTAEDFDHVKFFVFYSLINLFWSKIHHLGWTPLFLS